MENKMDLKRMSRRDLLEILVLQSKKIDQLESELSKLNESINSRDIMLSEVGSIAEASLKLNDVFAVAQKAADQYLENIKRLENEQKILCEKLKKESNKKKTKRVKKHSNRSKSKLVKGS